MYLHTVLLICFAALFLITFDTYSVFCLNCFIASWINMLSNLYTVFIINVYYNSVSTSFIVLKDL